MTTVADRLQAIVAKAAPKTLEIYKGTSGKWPGRSEDDVRRHAPYEILALRDGSRRVRVFGDDGSVKAGNGPTTEAAVADLEKSLGLAQAKG